MSGSIKNNSRA